MLKTRSGIRLLGPADLPQVEALLEREPITHVFVDHRVRLTRLQSRWLGGEMWGYVEDGNLVSLCHAAANLVPVHATPDAVRAFADRAVAKGRSCSSIVGPEDSVNQMWEALEPYWGPARLVRGHQPFLVLDTAPRVEPDPLVRRVRPDEFDILYPACVKMFTEEVGVSPEAGGGKELYQARVRQLISAGMAFARIEDGEVIFKAEIGAATPRACQAQGVWVRRERRGEGLSVAGTAAVMAEALRSIAPVVTLYVNEHNLAARRCYERVGFREHTWFTTILF
ncbi:MAG: GNAT family N-acetyltransferase [Propionibacteriales bacterium]|nr:GNAT family N-acetyltransferase [Propionibacteriales bacterium]